MIDNFIIPILGQAFLFFHRYAIEKFNFAIATISKHERLKIFPACVYTYFGTLKTSLLNIKICMKIITTATFYLYTSLVHIAIQKFRAA